MCYVYVLIYPHVLYPTVEEHQTAVEDLSQPPFKWRILELVLQNFTRPPKPLESTYLCFHSVVPVVLFFIRQNTFIAASQVEHQILILRC